MKFRVDGISVTLTSHVLFVWFFFHSFFGGGTGLTLAPPTQWRPSLANLVSRHLFRKYGGKKSTTMTTATLMAFVAFTVSFFFSFFFRFVSSRVFVGIANRTTSYIDTSALNPQPFFVYKWCSFTRASLYIPATSRRPHSHAVALVSSFIDLMLWWVDKMGAVYQ